MRSCLSGATGLCLQLKSFAFERWLSWKEAVQLAPGFDIEETFTVFSQRNEFIGLCIFSGV